MKKDRTSHIWSLLFLKGYVENDDDRHMHTYLAADEDEDLSKMR